MYPTQIFLGNTATDAAISLRKKRLILAKVLRNNFMEGEGLGSWLEPKQGVAQRCAFPVGEVGLLACLGKRGSEEVGDRAGI